MLLTRQYIMGTAFQGLNISSAGINTIDGEPITQCMAVLLEEMGIDSTDFRSTMITSEIIRDSGIIIVLDNTHRRYINRVSPHSRVYFLADMIDGNFIHREIPDPFGMDFIYYRQAFGIIRNSVCRMVRENFYSLL